MKRPGLLLHKHSSTLHYQTFPRKPPAGRGRPPPSRLDIVSSQQDERGTGTELSADAETPLPTGQLIILAVIALAEQTAFNFIGPYLPDMVSTFPEVQPNLVGFYVGLIASSFALAQVVANLFWGWLSDRTGRRPVILLGTVLTAACFVAFGFCSTVGQAIAVQRLMGVVNGTQGVLSTCLGEITDRSNQGKAFMYLPVIYGLCAVTGPAIGGLIVAKKEQGSVNHPYLLPNLVAAAILMLDFVLSAIYLGESLQEAKGSLPLREQASNIFARVWRVRRTFCPSQFRHGWARRAASPPGYRNLNQEGNTSRPRSTSAESSHVPIPNRSIKRFCKSDLFNRNTVILLLAFLVFQISNVAYNSLYPVFAQGNVPTGRNLGPGEIGLSLSFAGLVTIIFQVGIFQRLRDRIGNRKFFRASHAGLAVVFLLMPWITYKESSQAPHRSGNSRLWIELGAVLIPKTIAVVGGLTSALLLLPNSAPDQSVLGTLNGLAQSLSAADRVVGPFVAGSLFSLSTKIKSEGEALAFGFFAGVSFLGFLLSFGINSSGT